MVHNLCADMVSRTLHNCKFPILFIRVWNKRFQIGGLPITSLGLWVTPLGLGIIYYLLPKITGFPIASYQLSLFGFWGLALFYSQVGAHHLLGGPIPTWLGNLSIVMSVGMAIPVITVAINHHVSTYRHFHVFEGIRRFKIHRIRRDGLYDKFSSRLTAFTAHVQLYYTFHTLDRFSCAPRAVWFHLNGFIRRNLFCAPKTGRQGF